MVEAWEASGASVPTFAQRSGLVAQRVYWWKARLRRTRAVELSSATRSQPPFIPLTLRGEVGAARSAVVTVVLSPEVRVEMAELDAMSAAWVATLVKSLREVLA